MKRNKKGKGKEQALFVCVEKKKERPKKKEDKKKSLN